jgi:predicted short-subunit dehydrogenase-like oxidoreductase (DUF2520 family)
MGDDGPRLCFVGCGRLGLSLGRLFTDRRLARVDQILTRSRSSARAACDFIQAGRPVDCIEDLRALEIVLIATPDADLGNVCEALASSSVPLDGVTVCHLSGALPSSLLSPLRDRGADVASIHPIRSFTRPEVSDDVLLDVVCGAEGDNQAITRLAPLFEACGAHVVPIDPDAKTLYHTAAVLACNGLVGLMEASLRCYEAAGLSRDMASAAVAPLVRGTVDNILQRGPAGALSGPIVRAEVDVVARQLTALEDVSDDILAAYRALARITLPLSRSVATAEAERLDALARLLNEDA